MPNDEIDDIVERQMEQRRERPSDRMLIVRNVLNIIFMVCAVVGVVFILKGNQTMGAYIVMVAIVFKVAEAAIRMLRR